MASKADYLLVAAFDFGTTYSGYAFSFHSEPTKIQTNLGWNAGTEKLISLKTPTCVLVNPKREFHAFGFEAENKYISLTESDTHREWFFFRRFKMLLHNNKGLTKNTNVEDINGNSMRAITIFAMAIRFLKDHMLSVLQTQTVGIEETDIRYVITVPAIWTDSAKQFMREAAFEAGIALDRLKLALEPEAASIWCQTITTNVKNALTCTGTQYMVIDLGGGTADISVHEKKSDGTLKELHKASGGPWGGNVVDNNYIQFYVKLFGRTTMNRFRQEEMVDYFDLLRDFEVKKRTVMSQTNGFVTFRICVSLKEIYDETEKSDLNSKIVSLGLNGKVNIHRDKLKIDVSIVRTWFEDPIDKMVHHVREILAENEMKDVNIILLVGGFGECALVQTEMTHQFPNKTLLVPDEAGLAVLKGAVKFGHCLEIVSSRIMKFTYGVSFHLHFDKNRHPLSDMFVDDDGVERVRNGFQKFVEIGQEIAYWQQVTHTANFLKSNTSALLDVYCSTEKDPILTTSPSCTLLGSLLIEHPTERNFRITIHFGDTELIVMAKFEKSGEEFQKYIDCLNKNEL